MAIICCLQPLRATDMCIMEVSRAWELERLRQHCSARLAFNDDDDDDDDNNNNNNNNNNNESISRPHFHVNHMLNCAEQGQIQDICV